jgi:hypothetical protein
MLATRYMDPSLLTRWVHGIDKYMGSEAECLGTARAFNLAGKKQHASAFIYPLSDGDPPERNHN